ncbi:MAG TPA: outer membrane beta-barrel protein [Saprospiraceae bacterium]|nr:outer membrane beta-barrel protein [Saprospiraceae bacterium]HMP13058.1 outer membrane beta-barrel protein [Saprospiraceae bacterium]
MKKIVVTGAFFFIGMVLMQAQNDIRFGFQASPTFAWMNTTSSRINPSGTNLGIKLGMVGEYYFRENYAFTSGLGFAFNQGGTLQHEFGGLYWRKSDLGPGLDTLPAGVKLKYGIQYIEIPAGMKMRTREFGYLRYFVEPALTLGFRSQARGTAQGRGIGSDLEKINIRKEVNAFNLAWGLGAGVEYTISESTSLVGGLGFQVGFTDVTDDNGTTFDPVRGNRRENSKGKNNAIVLRLGVMF